MLPGISFWRTPTRVRAGTEKQSRIAPATGIDDCVDQSDRTSPRRTMDSPTSMSASPALLDMVTLPSLPLPEHGVELVDDAEVHVDRRLGVDAVHECCREHRIVDHALVVREDVPGLEHDPPNLVPGHQLVQGAAAPVATRLDLDGQHWSCRGEDEIDLDAVRPPILVAVPVEVSDPVPLSGQHLGHHVLGDRPQVHAQVAVDHRRAEAGVIRGQEKPPGSRSEASDGHDGHPVVAHVRCT